MNDIVDLTPLSDQHKKVKSHRTNCKYMYRDLLLVALCIILESQWWFPMAEKDKFDCLYYDFILYVAVHK